MLIPWRVTLVASYLDDIMNHLTDDLPVSTASGKNGRMSRESQNRSTVQHTDQRKGPCTYIEPRIYIPRTCECPLF